MVTYTIEDIHDISIDTAIWSTTIDIKDIRGATARIVLPTDDAEILAERLYEALNKNRG